MNENKTALGRLSNQQYELNVGGLTIRERLNVGSFGLKLRKKVSEVGVTLHNFLIGESEKVDGATFLNISNHLKVPKRFQRKFVKDVSGQQSIMGAILKGQLQNPLYLWLRETLNILEIIDGQQRWVTCKNFLSNKFSLGSGVIVEGITSSSIVH